MSSDFRPIWSAVMLELAMATHCHGCGVEFKVVFDGYCHQYCSKSCWRDELDAGEDFECPFDCGDGCVICDGGHVSLVNSRHATLGEWPMRVSRPCLNECLRTRSPVSVY